MENYYQKEIETASYEQIRAWQSERLVKTVKHVYENNTYYKKLMDENGNPTWQLFTQDVGQNFIADKVLSVLRQIEADFDTEIGIPNANTDKRERLITDEVNSNNIETLSKCSLWLQELKKSIEQTNDMFGLDISIDWRFPPQEGGTKIGSSDSFDIGAV